MRKFLIGCGIVSLLIFCLVVGAGIWGYTKLKQAKETFGQMKDAYEETNRLYKFSDPDPPAMKEGRFLTYLAVRNEFGAAIEGELELLSRLSEAAEAAKAENRKPDLSWDDLKTLIGLPKRVADAHVKALKDHSMSLGEYLWYSKTITGTTLKAAKEGRKVSEQILKAYAQAYEQLPKDSGLPPPPPQGELPDFAPMERILKVTDVPFLPENLALIQDHADGIAKYPQLVFVDLFLRQQGPEKSPPAASAPAQSANQE